MDSGAQSPRPAGKTGTPGRPAADDGTLDGPAADTGTSDRPAADISASDGPTASTGTPGRPATDGADGGALGIGRRIRGLREERGISLSALARAAGVGKATLSGLENGTRNPTLETLWAITAELGVPLAMAVGTPPPVDADGSGRTEGVPVVHGTAVEGTLLQVFEDEKVTYELYRLVIRAGTTQVSPAHHEGVTEHVTVFAGTLSAGPAGAPLRAGPGEHVSWRSDVPHAYTVLGDQDVHASLLIRYPRR
ncbi:helix-turn-helix domain-containing protein [Streptosporangium sp. NPDC002721]|uniref:helix-turn-helix domain-containing protein n=1 Tax=Streptosporangium sp. NPDC002721 TaxID=3366188 RepID=UPI0036CFA1EA